MKKRKFFVYVDYTSNGVPFYVGKGTCWRLLNKERNSKHTRIAKKHGQERQVVLETFDEKFAFQIEIQFIKEFHTFHHDPLAHEYASNFTLGGDGPTGLKHKPETLQIIREKRAKQTNIRHSAIAQYTLEGTLIKVYSTISEATNQTGIGNIISCEMISNYGKTRKMAGGFMWRRIIDENNVPQTIEPYKGPRKVNITVKQFDLNGNYIQTFESMTLAAKETNTKKYHIAFQCEGRKPFNNDKFIWKYEFPERFLKSNRYKTKITNKIGVSQFSKDGILIAHYNSINEAQRKTGVLDLLLKVQNIKTDNEFNWVLDSVQQENSKDIIEITTEEKG